MGSESYAVGMAKLYWMGTVSSASTNLLYRSVKNFCGTYSFGNIVAAEIAPSITYLDHYISYRGDRRKDKTIATQKAVSIPFTFDEINATNVARFMYASDLTGGKYAVMQAPSVPVEGTAVLFFSTDIGKDFMYVIPKAALKAEGGLPFNIDSWMQGKFTLEVLSATYTASLTSTSAPFGFLDFTAVATVAGG